MDYSGIIKCLVARRLLWDARPDVMLSTDTANLLFISVWPVFESFLALLIALHYPGEIGVVVVAALDLRRR